MKRDMELVRQLLIKIEESPDPCQADVQIDNYDPKAISYHVKLLADAGLIEARHTSTFKFTVWQPICLTWQGHEFLDAARNESVWNKTKAIVERKGWFNTF